MDLPSVLIVGGSGVTGQAVSKLLRARHPTLPLTVAGRDRVRAQECAEIIGATSARVDVHVADLAWQGAAPSAVVMLAKDVGLHGLEWARRLAVPYIGISTAAFEYGVEGLHTLARPPRGPVVLAGHWFAGAAVASALDLALRLERVDSVVVGVMVDRRAGGGGPASVADFEKIARSSPTTLARIDGAYVWQSEAESRRPYRGAGGAMVEGKGSVSLDVLSIASATGAANVRVLETWGESHHYALTGNPADEVSVEVTGELAGRPVTARQVLTRAVSEAPSLTAICVVLLLERALGLDGRDPASAGVYSPELLIAPDLFVTQLRHAGVQIETAFDG